jgi:hypothetical protein
LTVQKTLLGFAIAVIAVLVAGLVAPLFVNWSSYRNLFEEEAKRLIGVDVGVKGEISARLLPSPRVTLQDVAIGNGQNAIRARSLVLQLTLGPLTRGILRAEELSLDAPEIALSFDPSGHLRAPDISLGFRPDAFSVERLHIENGKITLADFATGEALTLDRVRFNGNARSIFGPFIGEGSVSVGAELYPLHISTGRYSDGSLRVSLGLDQINRQLNLRVDGLLALADATPRFDGNVTLARPASVLTHQRGLAKPWRMSAKVRATLQSAFMDNVEFLYDSQDRGFKFNGTADVKFGRYLQINTVLSSKQIDLDRLLAEEKGGRKLPVAVLEQLAYLFPGAMDPAIHVRSSININNMTLGGGTLHNLHGEFNSSAQGLDLDELKFLAPGFVEIRASGKLAPKIGGVVFSGPMTIEANDPKMFAGWLQRGEEITSDIPRPLKLRGNVTLGDEGLSVKSFIAEFEHQNINGQFSLSRAANNRPGKLEVALETTDLDVDATLAFGRAVLAGSKLEWPHDIMISADIARATVGDFAGHNASLRMKVDSTGLQIDKFSIADFGGASFSASGHIVRASTSPRGHVRIDLDAPNLSPVVALLSRFVPKVTYMIEEKVAAISPAKLHGQFLLEGADPSPIGKFIMDGNLGKAQLTLSAQMAVNPVSFAVNDMHVSGRLDDNDGKQLITAFGLEHVFVIGSKQTALTFSAEGRLQGPLFVNGQIISEDFQGSIHGTADTSIDNPSFAMDVIVPHAKVLLWGGGETQMAVPLIYTGHVALAGQKLTLTNIKASVGATSLRGQVELFLTQPRRLQGEVSADDLDSSHVIAAIFGAPTQHSNSEGTWSWSPEPFVWWLSNYIGTINFKGDQIALLPKLTAHELRTTMRFNKDDISFDGITADLAGGELAGTASFRSGEDGLRIHSKLSLANADLANVLSGAMQQPPIKGSFALNAELLGNGLSPLALVNSLSGTGRITLTNASVSGLNPAAFDAAILAVDAGTVIDKAHIAGIVSKVLPKSRLSMRRADGELTINAGQIRVNETRVAGEGADLSVSGTLSLVDGLLDARLLLRGLQETNGVRPDIDMTLMGPLTNPSRETDISALIAWLTLRSVENQTKKVETKDSLLPKSQEQLPLGLPQNPRAVTPPSHEIEPPLQLFPPLSPAPVVAPAAPGEIGLGSLPLDITTPPPESQSPTIFKPRTSMPRRILFGAHE